MKSEIKSINNGNAKAFHCLVKYAPPKSAIAPKGEKLAAGEIS
jgi:hypothetical protein